MYKPAVLIQERFIMLLQTKLENTRAATPSNITEADKLRVPGTVSGKETLSLRLKNGMNR